MSFYDFDDLCYKDNQPCLNIVFDFFLFPVDIWSVGCIMGEMVKGNVIFQGTDRILHPPLSHSFFFFTFYISLLLIPFLIPLLIPLSPLLSDT